ncbi:MAG: hypothetical protein IKI37_06485 [Oscillospiraceae bacterium]|nr:hypothetical protein [Oscillospiraceae bacterium]
MIFPDKLYSYNESVLSKFPVILKELKKSPANPAKLYHSVQKHFSDVSEFIEALDCLYLLNRIDYDSDAEVLNYVD